MFNEIVWKDGEKKAQEYMKQHGYKILYTNYYCAGVELDIVAILPAKVQDKLLKQELNDRLKIEQNAKTKAFFKENYKKLRKNLSNLLIITEVKARSSASFGLGVEAVGSTKIYHIKRGADYLMQRQELNNLQVRFDIASIDGEEITYIENAF